MDEGDISQSDVDKFSDALREFFETAYTYCVIWLPLDDPLYKGNRFIKYSNWEKFSFDDLTELLSLFLWWFENYIQDPYQPDSLEEEYLTYQSIKIPEDIWEKSSVKVPEECIYHCTDIVWGHLRTSLPKLANIPLFLLTILRSNAAEEHIFSVIAKSKTKFQSSLDNKKSLNLIMLIEINKPKSFKPCYQWNF